MGIAQATNPTAHLAHAKVTKYRNYRDAKIHDKID